MEQQGAGAHAGDPGRRRRAAADPVDHRGVVHLAAGALPPGTSSTSRGGWSSNVWSGSTRRPLAQRTGPACSAIVTTVRPVADWARSIADEVKTSQGPTKSSSSAPSKSSSRVVTSCPPPVGPVVGSCDGGTVTVVGRGDPEAAVEGAAQRLGGAEPQPAGDRPRPARRPRPRRARRLDPHLLDVRAGVTPTSAVKRRAGAAGSGGRARPGRRCRAGRRGRRATAATTARTGSVDGLRRPQRHAELRLAARPPQEQHQLAGHRVRDVVAEVVLDQGEREVDARR